MAAVTNKTQEVMRLPRMLPFDGMPNGLEALTPEGLLQFVALLGPDNASHTGKVGELICPSCFTFEAFDEGVDLALLFKKVPSFPDSIKQVVLNLTPSHLYYSFAVGQCEVLLERSWMAKVIEPPAGVDPFNLKANASSSAYRSTMKGADTREKTRKAHLPVHLARACVGVASQMSEVIREVAQGQKFAATFDNELDVYALFMSCCMEGFDIAAVMKLVTDEFFSRCSNSGKKQNCSVDVIMRRLTPLPLFNKKESIGGHADIYCLVSSYNDSYLKTIVTPLHVPDDAGTSSSFELRGVDGVCGYALGMFIFEMYNTLFRRVALVCSWIRRVEVSSGKELTWTDSEVKQLQDHLAAHEPFDVAEWQADKLKSRGNDVYKNSDWTAAADAYTQAISMAPVHSAIRAVCLVNRATVRLTQYQKLPSLSKADTKVAILGLMEGHRDCTSAISGDPMYWKAYHRRMQIALALARMPTLTFTAEELADAIASSSIAGFDSRGGAFLAALADAVAVVQYSPELRDVAAEAVLSAIDEDLHDSYVRDIVESPPQVSFNCHATLRLFSQSLVFPLPCYPGGVGPRGMLDAGLSSDLLGLLGFVRPHPLAVALVNMVQPMRTCRRTTEPVTGGAKLPGLSDSDSTCETAILWGQNALTYYPKEFGPGSPWRQAAIEGLQSAGAAVDKKASTLAQLEAGAAKVKSVTGDSEQQQQQQQQQQNKATNKSKGDSSAAATQAKAEAAKTAAATEAQKKKEAAEAAETKRRAEEKRKADEKTAKAEERKRAEEEKRKAEELARQKQRERDKEEALKKKEAARKLREEQEAKKKEEEEAAFRRLVELEAAAAVEEELRLKRETEDVARAKADAKSAKTKKVTTPATAPAAVPSKAVSPVAEGKTTDFPDAPVTPSPATEARPPQQPQQRSGSGKPTAAQPKANPSAATPLTEDSDDEEVQARRLEAEARRLRELAEAKKRVKEQQQGATAATKPLEAPPVVRQHSDPTPTAPPKSGLPLPRSAQTASATSPLVAATSPPQTTTPEPTQTKTPSGVPLPRSQRVAAGGMDKSASSSPPSTQEVPAASSPPSTAAQVVNVLSNLVPSARVHGPSTTTELKGKRAKDANGNGAVTVASPPPPSWQEPPARSSTSFTVTAQEDNMESRQLSGVSINDSSPATPNVAGPVLLKGRVKAGNNQNATANAKTTTVPPQAVNPFTPHASASFAAPVPVGAEAPRSPAVTTTTAASTFTMKAAVTTSPAPPPVGAAPSPSFLFDTSSWAPTNGPTQAAPSLSMFANNFRSTTAPKTELPASWQAQPLLQLNAAKPSAEPRRDGEGVVEFDFDLARVNFSDFM